MEARLEIAPEAGRAAIPLTAGFAKDEPTTEVVSAVATTDDRPLPPADEHDGHRSAPQDGEETSAANGVAVQRPDSGETNVWPTASEEAAFLSEAQGRGEKIVPVARATIEEVEERGRPLPKLDELVNRIPADTRELLDELFRAKFTAVKRIKKSDLKA